MFVPYSAQPCASQHQPSVSAQHPVFFATVPTLPAHARAQSSPVYVNMNISVYIYVFVCIFVYIHTHIHTTAPTLLPRVLALNPLLCV